MPIDQFTKSRFEAALPVVGGQLLWSSIGLRDGEHCYLIPVKPGVVIYIRSSVDSSGLAAPSAKNSIRCWLASDDKGNPLSSKVERWITRVNGWEERLTETLRKLWRLGRQLHYCERCQPITMTRAFKAKTGDHTGQFFQKCPNCGHFYGWLREIAKQKGNL